MRGRKNPKKDYRSSRQKWADTTKSVRLQLHQAYDLLLAGGVLRYIAPGKPLLGTDKHFITVPKDVFAALKRHDLIRLVERKNASGRWLYVYGANPLPPGGVCLALETSRENERHRKNNVGTAGKSMGKTPFQQ